MLCCARSIARATAASTSRDVTSGRLTSERRLRGELRQELRVVRQSLRQRRDLPNGSSGDLHASGGDAACGDLGELASRHPRHMDLGEGALDRAVLADELSDAVGDTDEEDGDVHDAIRERLDRVREQDPDLRIPQPVELVDEDGQLTELRHRLERLPDGVRGHWAGTEEI